jgi:hypothetical protein
MSREWRGMTDVEVIENVLTCRKAYASATVVLDDTTA